MTSQVSERNVALLRPAPLLCEKRMSGYVLGWAAALRTAVWLRGLLLSGTVKVSWVPGAISWPECCAAAGYQISQGNRRSREVSSASIVRTPTGKRPRTNGSYLSLIDASHIITSFRHEQPRSGDRV